MTKSEKKLFCCIFATTFFKTSILLDKTGCENGVGLMECVEKLKKIEKYEKMFALFKNIRMAL